MKFFSSSAFGGQLRKVLFYLSILYVIFYLKVGLVYLATANLRRKLILKMRSHEGNLEVSDVGCVRAIAAFVLNKLLTTVSRVRNILEESHFCLQLGENFQKKDVPFSNVIFLLSTYDINQLITYSEILGFPAS